MTATIINRKPKGGDLLNMSNVYEGGLPPAGKNLFPSYDGEGENGSIPGAGGSGDMEPTNSGPATFSGSVNKSFHDQPGYDTGDLNVDTDPAMKIVNPDDIKTNC